MSDTNQLRVDGPLPSLSTVLQFEADGIVCVRRLLGTEEVEALKDAVCLRMRKPGPLAQEFGAPGARFFSDIHLWRDGGVFGEIIRHHAVVDVARELLRSRTLRLLYDQILVKEPGSDSATPWHQDLPFWPVKGHQVLSCWIGLDPVDDDNGGVTYARGSHRLGKLYRPTQPDTPETRVMRNMSLPACPNLFNDPGADLVSWDMQPGDALFFHALTCHGARANRSARLRRALVLRFAGEDVVFVSGPHALRFPTPPQLTDGEPLGGADFPLVAREV